jgi:GntR family transcriptional regulator
MSQVPFDLAPRLGRFARQGVPKYIALRDAIVDAVTSGDWRPGTRLPAESEWTGALSLSLGTIQRALRLLAEDGVIVRRPKHGTFVAERSVGRMRAPLHCRFVDDSGKGYLPVYPKVTARYPVAADGPWSSHLGTPKLVCIERILRIGREFKVFSRFYFDPQRLAALAALTPRRLSGENFKDIILRETGQPIGRISQLLSRAEIPRGICRAIGVKPGTEGELLEVVGFAGREHPIYYQELYIPPNRRRLHLAADGKDEGLEAGGRPGPN